MEEMTGPGLGDTVTQQRVAKSHQKEREGVFYLIKKKRENGKPLVWAQWSLHECEGWRGGLLPFYWFSEETLACTMSRMLFMPKC